MRRMRASPLERLLVARGNSMGKPLYMVQNSGKERSDCCSGLGGRQVFHNSEEFHYSMLDVDKKNWGDFSAYISMYCSLLATCIEKKSWANGKQIHIEVIKYGFQPSLLLANLLLEMYVNCGYVEDARKLFHTLRHRNLCTWALLFRIYAGQQHWEDSLALFWQMWSNGIQPNKYIFVIVLQACAQVLNLEGGKVVYSCIIKSGCKVTKTVASALISMYTKCGRLVDARSVFDEISGRNVVLWSAILAGYAQQGHSEDAIKLFWQMQNDDGIEPNQRDCISILKACAKIGAHNEGRKIHDCIMRNSFDLGLSVGNTLIDMYSKCGCLMDARRIFEKIVEPDFISWSAMVAGYGESGNTSESFKLFSMMESRGVHVNEVTFLNLLKGCASVEYLDKAREVYSHVISRGLMLTSCLENALVNVFAKCGLLRDACHVFWKLSIRNVVSWSALIAGHAHHGFHNEALMLFNKMLEEGTWPNATTFVSILKVIASLQNVEVGRCIHFWITEDGLETELFIGSALVDMYAKCAAVKDAREVFDCMPRRNIVVWSSIMACYAQQATANETIELFWQMLWEDVKPDEITFVCVLRACSIWAMLEQGMYMHNYVLDMGSRQISFFLGSALVDMYTRCGSLADARHMFDEIKQRDVALWNAMISGYGQYGYALEAFKLSSQMDERGVPLNYVTCVGLLSACSHAGLLHEGLQLFYLISLDHSVTKTMEQCVCMVDLLGRVGCLPQALILAQAMPFQPDATIWLSLVGVSRLNSNLQLATAGVRNLLEIEPDSATVLVLLSNIVYEVG